MSFVNVTLRPDEREALIKLALIELRTPRDQARYILRRELKRRKLLQPADNPLSCPDSCKPRKVEA